MNNDFYTEKIASDPNTSPDILKKILGQGNDDRISRMAVSNLNCPPESIGIVLERLFVDPRSYSPMCIYRFAAHNPNCPHDTLKKIFERKKDDAISCNAVSNLNCPPELLKNVCRLW